MTGYPKGWPSISHAVKVRARWRCQDCGVAHLAWGWRDALGRFHAVDRRNLIRAGHSKAPFDLLTGDGRTLRIIEIVLAAAHRDHDTSNPDPANLAALCQRCHLLWDARQHRRTSARTRRAEMSTDDLFMQAS